MISLSRMDLILSHTQYNQCLSLLHFCLFVITLFHFLSLSHSSIAVRHICQFGSMLTWLRVFPAGRAASRTYWPPVSSMKLSSFCTGQVVVSRDPICSMTHFHFLPALSTCQSFFFFSSCDGANVEPWGRLTEKLEAYANFITAQPLVSSASCRNDVSFGNALILTLISTELLMVNRVGVCF